MARAADRVSVRLARPTARGAPAGGRPRCCSPRPAQDLAHGSYFVSTLLVALAEMGDRTQLLAIMLASRYRKPVPILLGILVATLANHGLAALAGFYLSSLLSAIWFKYAVSASFIAMALWALIPDKEDEEDGKPAGCGKMGVFLTTAVSFFLVEMGDKTQIATAALAARYHDVLVVAAGTTTGMMLANIPAVLLGHAVTRVLPIRALRIAAACSTWRWASGASRPPPAGCADLEPTGKAASGRLELDPQRLHPAQQDVRAVAKLFCAGLKRRSFRRSSRIGKAICISLRARLAPMQVWMPAPKARCERAFSRRDVEAVGIGEVGFVAVGRAVAHQDHLALLDRKAADLRVARRHAATCCWWATGSAASPRPGPGTSSGSALTAAN